MLICWGCCSLYACLFHCLEHCIKGRMHRIQLETVLDLSSFIIFIYSVIYSYNIYLLRFIHMKECFCDKVRLKPYLSCHTYRATPIMPHLSCHTYHATPIMPHLSCHTYHATPIMAHLSCHYSVHYYLCNAVA